MITDETLARRVQTGDRAAFAALVERHYDALFGYLYRLTARSANADRALAEDLVQETCLRAFRRIDTYDPARPFKAWLYGIATHAARDHVARADSRRVQNADEDFDAPASDGAPDAALIAVDEMQAVIAAVAALPDLHREVVILFYYQSLSLQAIADALDIPLGTVKSRLSNAVRKLREHMQHVEQS